MIVSELPVGDWMTRLREILHRGNRRLEGGEDPGEVETRSAAANTRLRCPGVTMSGSMTCRTIRATNE